MDNNTADIFQLYPQLLVASVLRSVKCSCKKISTEYSNPYDKEGVNTSGTVGKYETYR